MTCTFGYVFLLSSAHKRRKFFLQMLVRLVQPEALQQVVQKPSGCPETRIPDTDSWSGAMALSLVAKYSNLFITGLYTPASADTDVDASDSHLHSPVMYLLAASPGIMELSFPRTFAPKSESTIGGTFAPWYFHSLELSLSGTFAPWNFRSLELSLPGAKVTWNFRSLELSFPGTFAPVPIRKTYNRRSQHKGM